MKELVTVVVALVVLSGCTSKDEKWLDEAKNFRKDEAAFCGTAGIQSHIPDGDTTVILCKDNTFKILEL